jgi:integrase
MAKERKFEGVTRRGKRSFRIDYKDAAGVRQWETVKCGTPEEARDIRQDRMGMIARGVPLTSKPSRVTFGELAADVVKDYKANGRSSWKDIEGRFRLHLNPVFETRRAATITTEEFKSYRDLRLSEGATPGTVNRELEAARRAYRLGQQSTPPKVFFRPHIPMLEENNVREGFFEEEQIDALCRQLPAHLVPIARFGYITGWRHGEVVSRRWKHIHFAAGEIRLEQKETKNKKGRTFPMTRALRQLLKKLKPPGQPDPDAPVFKDAEGAGQVKTFYKAWATACRAVGLPVRWAEKRDRNGAIRFYKRGACKGEPIMVCRAAVHFHDFRRTAYRNLVRLHVPESVAQKAVGWIDPNTARRYDITSKADQDIVRNALDGANFGAKIRRTYVAREKRITVTNDAR